MDKIRKYCSEQLVNQHFDCLAVGVIDFNSGVFETINLSSNEIFEGEKLFFDLASMTKPFTCGVAYLAYQEIFTKDHLLLLNHQAGIPRWGRLSKSDWRAQIGSYKISASETNYSDFGMLRLQLEIEKELGHPLYELVSKYWDSEVKHWSELSTEVSPITGTRFKRDISGVVHDDNAFVVGEKISHAGLFASIDGVCKTLLKLNEELDLIKTVGIDHEGRFSFGWDTVENPTNTLAGAGCSKNTFGHLGFTGTSMWIDPKKGLGHVILTNETLGYWYQRENLNALRREVGRLAFL